MTKRSVAARQTAYEGHALRVATRCVALSPSQAAPNAKSRRSWYRSGSRGRRRILAQPDAGPSNKRPNRGPSKEPLKAIHTHTPI